MNTETLKQFFELYMKINEVDYNIDKNRIYTANFKEILANKLGKQRKLSFNKTISDDYGVEYMSMHNDIMKYILRDCISKGLIVKATISANPLFKDKLKLDKNILIKNESRRKDIAIAFLFKISSNNRITENTPEFLRYVIVGYNDWIVLSDDLANEFHNMELTKTEFKFDPVNVDKSHSVAYETLRADLEYKYTEHESANEEFYKRHVEDLKQRHEQLVKECRLEEKKLLDKISEKQHRVSHSRTYDAEDKYRKEMERHKQDLSKLKEENQKKIEQDHYRTEKRIEEEKEKYNFEVNTYLVSCTVFEYDIANLILLSTITNQEVNLSFNLLTNQLQEYICPICKNKSHNILLSIDGHFCCDQCATYYEEKKVFLCKKDNVAKCLISGKFVPKTKEYYCESCERYYDKPFLKKDIISKTTCELCIKKTNNGEIINKKDAVYSKAYDAYFKPSDVAKCTFSHEIYPLTDLIQTSGTDRLIAKKFEKMCKYTKLTFAPNEMASDGVSLLIQNLKEIETRNIQYPKLKKEIPKNKVEFNENKKWVVVRIKGLLRSKYLLYNKSKNELQK